MGGPFAPLASRLFALVFVVNLTASLTVFMNGLAAAWLLTDLTRAPGAVAALQVAVTLPGFGLALVAGALADVVDRRRLVRFSLGAGAVVAAVFGWLSMIEAHSEVTILLLTGLLGVLTSLAAPAWMAVIPGLVPRDRLGDAMTLSSAGMSGAMAVGPALGGVIIAALGPIWVFWCNVLAFTIGVIALGLWRPAARRGLPSEHLGSAVAVGLRYLRFDRPLQITIAKIVPFAIGGTALTSLLPVLARFRLDAGPATFGLLSGAAGLGAVGAVVLLGPIRRRLGPDHLVSAAMAVQAGAMLALASTTSVAVAFAALTVCGMTTLATVSTVMTSLQVVLPAWIRGRGIAVYLFVLQGSFTLGAVVWGMVAEQTGVAAAIAAAAVVMGVGAVLVVPLRLDRLAATDTTPVAVLDAPAVTSLHDHDGPIAVVVHWELSRERSDRFIAAMDPVGRALRRNGALSFQLAQDVDDPGRLIETFTMATWGDYQRLPRRTTVGDAALHRRLIEITGADLPVPVAHRVLPSGRSWPIDDRYPERSDDHGA
ncbi:MAG: MFS transporter [Actinomycetota bacterium]